MELLFVALGGTCLGIAARYALPLRQNHGVTVVPAVGTVVAAVVWVALTWLGWAWDGGWIWVVSLVVAALASAGTALWLGKRRDAADKHRLQELGGSALVV